MTLPVSGAISFNNINVELGVAGTTQASLGQSSYRTLAGVASGAISMSNFYGKSNRVAISYTFSSNTANASLNVTSIAGYSAGKSDITITVNAGVYVYSTNAANAGLTLTGGSTGDTVTLVNNGYIMGLGGNGSYRPAGSLAPSNNRTNGGNAISLGFDTTINNTNASAYIGGGGGGGTSFGALSGGGGAGGGIGGYFTDLGINPKTAATIGSVGANADFWANKSNWAGGGGGGGRIFPGTSGAGGGNGSSVNGKGGGAGGGGGSVSDSGGQAGAAGGASNNAGGSVTIAGSGGGGWGASGGTSNYGTWSGGAGGKAVALNGKTVTWTSGNTTRVYGAVS